MTRSTAAFNELKQGVHEIDNLADPTTGELHIAGSEPIVAGLFPAVIIGSRADIRVWCFT